MTRFSPLRVIVLDLSEAEMVDGGRLGILLFLHKWTSAKGIQCKLVNPSKFVFEMLGTGLTSVVLIFSVDDLIEVFRTDRPIENMDRSMA